METKTKTSKLYYSFPPSIFSSSYLSPFLLLCAFGKSIFVLIYIVFKVALNKLHDLDFVFQEKLLKDMQEAMN